MTWYNPLSWFATAKADVQAFDEKAESIVISLETEADKLVTNFQNLASTSAKEFASIKARLEADIALKQAALTAVNGELTKAQSVVPAAAPAAPAQQASPQPEQPAPAQ